MDSKPTARKMRHKTRGKQKLKNKRNYRRKRQQIKRNSKRWRKLNKAKIKRYEKRRRNAPQMYRMLPAKAASVELFDPTEDALLREREVEFWDDRGDDFGFVDWIDSDEGVVHTIIVGEGSGHISHAYDLLDFLDHCALMYEDDEDLFVEVLDQLYEGELPDEGSEYEAEVYNYER